MILSSDGLIMTNNHVIAGGGTDGKLLVAFSDGSTAPATLVGTDPTSDIAVIKVDGKSGLTPIELGSSEDVKVGEEVVAIGSPLAWPAPSPPASSPRSTAPCRRAGDRQPEHRHRRDPDGRRDQPGQLGWRAGETWKANWSAINTAIATAVAGGSIGLGFAIPSTRPGASPTNW